MDILGRNLEEQNFRNTPDAKSWRGLACCWLLLEISVLFRGNLQLITRCRHKLQLGKLITDVPSWICWVAYDGGGILIFVGLSVLSQPGSFSGLKKAAFSPSAFQEKMKPNGGVNLMAGC